MAYLALGLIWQEAGHAAGAAGAYRSYLALDPEGRYARELRHVLLRLEERPPAHAA